jgi:BirA family transcriptional regulator, biotin operon repressor / biotin---[acetyl-CoA-carboxylase] ligase
MSRFDLERFRCLLQTRLLGQTCHYLPVIASTNTYLRALGQQGSPEGTIVFADAQTAGRGQVGRTWISPSERNLYVSTLLRPAIAPVQAPLISLLGAVALVDTLRRQGVVCGIKWPNDVLAQGRKVAGILTEMETHRNAVRFVVVGIGVNVNMPQEEVNRYLGAIAHTATSLQVVLGHRICRERLLAVLMTSLEHWYDRFSTQGEQALYEAWEARSLMRGRRISARTHETTWQGTAEGIDRAGHLVLRRDDGTQVVLTSAEVRFIDEPG